MCSIAAIPSELMLGHSPPVYGSLLYSSLMVTTPPLANRKVPTQIRSCLASASIHLDGLLKSNNSSSNSNSNSSSSSSNNNNGDASTADRDNAKRNKKRVVFADDRGRPLTQVRVITEPSNMPPLWTSAYVASIARGDLFHQLDDYEHLASSSSASADSQSQRSLRCLQENGQIWEVCFRQPASDYIAFRDKLEKNSVSLENVIVQESDHCLVGTVKVKNLAFVKEVTLKVTFDHWATQQDVECTYVEQPGLANTPTPVRSLYDTFRFSFDLPPKERKSARQVEFCVRYFTNGVEYWDNNDGDNYAVKKKRDASLEEQIAELLSACCGPSSVHSSFNGNNSIRRQIGKDSNNQQNRPTEEATRCNLRTWSEFASWQHLENDAPYW